MNANYEKIIEECAGDWCTISCRDQALPEDFIREFKDKVNWLYISSCQHLSEDFIREFQDKVHWLHISAIQRLSESFIREFKDKVHWQSISAYQKLSESFIREFQHFVVWNQIFQYQYLSEDFIREFKDKIEWQWLVRYQKLSKSFINEFKLIVPEDCWLYKDIEFKRDYIKNKTPYKIEGDYVYAYKSVRSTGYSVYNFQYYYEVGKTYEAHADHNIDEENSFGLSAWTKERALNYYGNGKLFFVKIHINDIAAIVYDGNKIRCSKLTFVVECDKQ